MSATPSSIRLEAAIRNTENSHSQVAQFWTVAKAIASKDSPYEAAEEIQRRWGMGLPERFAKDLVSSASTDSAWGKRSGKDLADAFIESIRPGSVLDSMLRYARRLPQDIPGISIATGFEANVTPEAALKAVRQVTPVNVDYIERKAAAIAVFSQELARSTDNESTRLIQAELTASVLRAINKSILDVLPKTAIASTGTAVGDLQAGIAAAGPSTGYVVAASLPLVQELAFAADGRMGINGGDFLGNVAVVAVDTGDGTAPMTIIPASRTALIDFGLTVRNAKHASVFMTDSPEEEPTMASLVSLFQTDSEAVLVERIYRLVAAADSIEVG